MRIPPRHRFKCRNRPDLGADPPLPARVNTASCPCSVRRCGTWLIRTMQALGHVRGCPVEPSHVPSPAAMLPARGALPGAPDAVTPQKPGLHGHLSRLRCRSPTRPAGTQRPPLAFTAPAPLPLTPAINTILAARTAAGPAHHAIHRKRRIALSPAARSRPPAWPPTTSGEPRIYLASTTSPGPARHQWQASAAPPTRPILPKVVRCLVHDNDVEQRICMQSFMILGWDPAL